MSENNIEQKLFALMQTSENKTECTLLKVWTKYDKMKEDVQRLLKIKGVTVDGINFHCKGLTYFIYCEGSAKPYIDLSTL